MKKSSKKLLIYVLSFILPVVVFLCCCAFLGIFPFGEKTILVSDMLVQYSTMFLFYKRLFSEGASIFYSFGAACGTPVLDMFSYYLASPFNLILLLFSEANITEAILILVLLKFGLSGLTFSIFLIKKFHKNDISIVAFSLCYALMAYAVAYFYNVMWLDALIWLPMIILGIERIFVRKKPLLFYGSLAIAIFSNWYTGYMLCIFSAIYSLYVVFRRKFDKKSLKKRVKSFFSMCLYGFLAVTTCAVILLPAFFSLNSHEKTVFGEENINFEILDLCSKFLISASNFEQITTTSYSNTYENLPAVYCGITMLILAIMYFFNSKIYKREKIVSGIVLAIILFSFYLKPINTVWHGFNGNVWYPYRYSFVFSFFLLLLAYKNWICIADFDKKKFLKIVGILAVIIVVVEKFEYSYIKRENVFLTLTVLFGISIILYFIFYKKIQMEMVFIGVVMFEIFVNTLLSINTYGFYDRNLYYNVLNSSKQALNEIQDDGFYRILIDDSMAYNFGLAYDYNSLNFSSSTQREFVGNFLKKFEGIENYGNHILLFPDMPIRNMLLGNKYIIQFNEDDSEYTLKKQEESLNIGFLADKKIIEMNLDNEENAFDFQNELLKNLLGKDFSCFEKVDYRKKVMEHVIQEEDSYRLMSDYTTVSYIFEDVKDDFYMQFFVAGDVEIYVNGVEQKIESNWRNIIFIENVVGRVEIKFVFKNKERIDKNDHVFYRLNENAFTEAYNELKKHELKLDTFSNAYIAGEVLNEDCDKILFLSIPKDAGWSAFVNEEKIEPSVIMDTFLGVELPEGICKIELIYFPKGLKLGGIISIFSMIFAIFFQKRLK